MAARDSGRRRYRVADGTQVAHADRIYAAGEEFEADASTAREWVARGWVSEVKAKAKRSK